LSFRATHPVTSPASVDVPVRYFERLAWPRWIESVTGAAPMGSQVSKSHANVVLLGLVSYSQAHSSSGIRKLTLPRQRVTLALT